MKALILSAGQGTRLLPLTAHRPKCLLPVGPCALIEWQVLELGRCGVDDIAVVVGFGADEVERRLAALRRPGLEVRPVLNPFFAVADNLASCWIARHEMDRDFVLLNGDTLFEAGALRRLLAAPAPGAPVSIAIDRKAAYDDDDMKVSLDGSRLVAVGKRLPPEHVHGESIGMLLFRGEGPRLFARALERAMRAPEGLRSWYLRVIDRLAATAGVVEAVSIEGLPWCEVDYPADLARARRMVEGWATEARAPTAGAA